jgi:hypothetical protein
MEGPTSSWGSRNRKYMLILHEHDDDNDNDDFFLSYLSSILTHKQSSQKPVLPSVTEPTSNTENSVYSFPRARVWLQSNDTCLQRQVAYRLQYNMTPACRDRWLTDCSTIWHLPAETGGLHTAVQYDTCLQRQVVYRLQYNMTPACSTVWMGATRGADEGNKYASSRVTSLSKNMGW